MRGEIGCVAEGKSRLSQARPYLGMARRNDRSPEPEAKCGQTT